MKERVTFVHSQLGGIDPALLKLHDQGLDGPLAEAVREDRLTIPFGELPQELQATLTGVRRFEVKWAGPVGYKTTEPFAARVSPGLHFWYTPSDSIPKASEEFCAPLTAAFGKFDCNNSGNFINDNINAAKENTFYFYNNLESLDTLASYLVQQLCSSADSACESRLRSISEAATVDVSFDEVSNALKLHAFWPHSKRDLSVPASSTRRTEVGVLGNDKPPNTETHELGLSGSLAVLLERTEPSAVLFAYAARHRQAEGSFSADFVEPTGLHPTLRLTIRSDTRFADDDECRPYVYLTLPNTIFTDRYQLADDLFLASKNLTAVPYISKPVDLEAPAYTTESWGSNVLLQLSGPPQSPNTPPAEVWTAEVPLHLRYSEPSSTGLRSTNVPYPVVFWACESTADIDFSTSPFDRTQLGYDGRFKPSTVFWHVEPQPKVGNRIINSIDIPVLNQSKDSMVALGTSVVIALGFCWVLWRIIAGYTKHGYGNVTVARKEPGKHVK